jgi:FkbM family methyltransferase
MGALREVKAVHGETAPLRRWTSIRALLYIGYLPRIVGMISNWAVFLLHYLGRRSGPSCIRFRNGLQIRDSEGTVAGTIAVVFVRRHYGRLGKERVIVDIGANVGVFSIYAASRCPSAVVFSYEPIPSNFRMLCTNIKANGFSGRIKASSLGVAAHSGSRRIYMSSSPAHSFVQSLVSQESEIIQCTTLGELIQDNGIECIDILKLNCEGAEYEILHGAPEALRQVRNIRMEYHIFNDGQHQIEKLGSYLSSQGFEVVRLDAYSSTDGFLWARQGDRQ